MKLNVPNSDLIHVSKTIINYSEQDVDGHTTYTRVLYNPIGSIQILESMHRPIENLCGREIKPCSTFGRFCEAGAILKRHRDREDLDWTVSIPLTPLSAKWSIFVENVELPFVVHYGFGILVEGRKQSHWREPLKLENAPSIWLLLHYTNV